MKKKLIKFVGLLFICCITAFGGVACKEDEPVHQHEYEAVVTAPTCTEQGFTTYTCSCGDTYTDTYVSALEHEFTNYVFNNDAKCGVNGTETATCNRDGCNEKDTRTKENSALEHEFANYVFNNDAKCGVNGTETARCEHANCMETDTRTKANSALDHKFTNYVFNNDAKCGVNGTETATCNHDGCNEKDTRTKTGTALSHSFTNYVSDNNATYEKDGTKTAKCNHGCGKTDTITDIGSMLVKNTLTFKTLTVNNTNVYGKVNNTTETFSLINEVVTSGKTKYIVSTDVYGIQQVATKTIPLEIGDNVVYITETLDGEPINVYTVTIRRKPIYTVSFNTNAGMTVESQSIEEDAFATEPEIARTGYTFAGWDYDFTQPITENKTVTASWTANRNTPYKVEYYLQNLESDGYTLQETVNLTGTTDTTATAQVKKYAHFTYNASKSVISGNIDGDGNRVLMVYYTRDSYSIIVDANNAKAGTSTKINGSYRFDKEITLTATTNAGYTWLGWFNGETLVCATAEFTFKAEKNVTYTAKWEANEATPYTVNYYLQNLENDEYSLQETVNQTGTTDTIATAEIKTFEHFAYNENASTTSGNIQGNGSQVLSVYYTRNTYRLSGNVTNAGTYKYGTQLSSVATVNLGYDFLGWYSGEELLSKNITYTFTIEKDVTAKISLKAEMENFIFTSTETTCSITGIKDKTVTEIVVPDYVTSIGSYAFKDCNSLTEITLPFVGVTKDGTYNTHFGYIFGASSYSSNKDYVPTSLKKVTITSATSIGDYAFYDCSSLTSIIIPDGVTSIGWCAFYNCSSLTSIEIPDGVTSIDGMAFEYCSSLTSINIPDSVTIIGAGAFYNCDGLTSITIPNSVTSIGSSAFGRCNSLTSINIPNSVTSIGNSAFRYCSSLTSIAIPDSVTSIGYEAFKGCSDLMSVVISNGVTSIDYMAFEYCSSLTNITIPDSVTNIGAYAFGDCSGLISVIIGNGVTSIAWNTFEHCSSLTSIIIPDNVTNIGNSAFKGCSSLTNVSLPDSLTSIGLYAFADCDGLMSIEIPNSVTVIDSEAFSGCTSLTSITIPDSVTSIGSYAFENCSSLTSITIPDSVTSIGWYAFEGCSSLQYTTKDGLNYLGNSNNPYIYLAGTETKVITTATIENSCKFIGSSAFYKCWSLTNVKIPDSVTIIDSEAFRYCSSLTSITIPDSVISISNCAFDDCSSLTSILIGNSVTNIGYHAFKGCSSLTNVSLPDSLTSIGLYAFADCDGLMSIEIPNSVTVIDSEAFSGCTSLTSITIPDSVTSIGSYAFENCSSLTSITIPDSVTSIGSHAFENCSSLTSITIPDSVTSIGSFTFHYCDSLTSITVDEKNTTYKSIDGNLYSKDGTTLIQYAIGKTATEFTIPNSVTSIGSHAFYGCSSLTSIFIPDSVTSIGSFTFHYCDSLTSITVDEKNTTYKSIDGNLYSKDGTTLIQYAIGKTATSFTIPDSVTSIGARAFVSCSSLTSIVIPDSVTSIGDYAFFECTKLESITFESTLEQWKAIEKGSGWNYDVPATEVICSDGNVTL